MSGMQPLAEWRRSHFSGRIIPFFWEKHNFLRKKHHCFNCFSQKSILAKRWISTIIFRRSLEHFTSWVALGSCGSPLQQSWRQTPVTPNSFRKFLVESSKYDCQIGWCYSARTTMREQLLKDGAAVEAVDASTNPMHSVRNKWMNPEQLDEWSDNNYINHSVNQYIPVIIHCKIQVLFHIHPYPIVYEVWYPTGTYTYIHI